MSRPLVSPSTLAGAALLALAAPAAAQFGDRNNFVVPSGPPVRMDVLVRGRPLPVVRHQSRSYLPVPGYGVPYEIRVRNPGASRITAVVSVDGLSVMTGQPASTSNPGYVINAGSEVRIEGFRRDRSTVSQFRFQESGRSFAARTGRSDEIGVIGLVAFEERRPPLVIEARNTAFGGIGGGGGRAGRSAPTSFALAAANGAEVGGTGTEAGENVFSPVERTRFDRSGRRTEITLYYDTPAALRRAGVPVPSRPMMARPTPFPRNR